MLSILSLILCKCLVVVGDDDDLICADDFEL